MKLTERYDLESIGNRSEVLVFDAIERLIDSGGMVCTCEDCVKDLAAWALNHVTPQYHNSLLTPLGPEPDQDRRTEAEIVLAIESGLKRLRQHPHHG